jgi:hypothetical protein
MSLMPLENSCLKRSPQVKTMRMLNFRSGLYLKSNLKNKRAIVPRTIALLFWPVYGYPMIDLIALSGIIDH